MRIAIEDLESLKELNDELEENHVETEKALQDDTGSHISFLVDEVRPCGLVHRLVVERARLLEVDCKSIVSKVVHLK